MALEIERKFLLANESWRKLARDPTAMRQGYLNQEMLCSIRVRTVGRNAWLNIKTATIGAQRHEFEYEIPHGDGVFLLEHLSRRPLIEKTRYYVDNHPHVWEIDVFEGDNAGLVVAEIELSDPAEPFTRPAWLGPEVTEDPRYYNNNLSAYPYSRWNKT